MACGSAAAKMSAPPITITSPAPVRNAWNGITGYDDLVAENEDLRGRIGELESADAAETNAREQLRRLNEQLDLGYVDAIPTQIVSIEPGTHFFGENKLATI